jgi:hypothetical protein
MGNHARGHLHSLFYSLNKLIGEAAKEENLKMFADYGTLLGACRNHAFIPWDSDLDYSVLSDEGFEERWNVFLQKCKDKGITVKSKKSDRNLGLGEVESGVVFIKRGVSADIFVWHKIEDRNDFIKRHPQLTLESLPNEPFWGRFRYAETDWRDKKGLFILDEWVKEFTTMKFGSGVVCVPKDWKELCEHRYPNWEVPVCQKPSTNALREFFVNEKGMKRTDALEAAKEMYTRLWK